MEGEKKKSVGCIIKSCARRSLGHINSHRNMSVIEKWGDNQKETSQGSRSFRSPAWTDRRKRRKSTDKTSGCVLEDVPVCCCWWKRWRERDERGQKCRETAGGEERKRMWVCKTVERLTSQVAAWPQGEEWCRGARGRARPVSQLEQLLYSPGISPEAPSVTRPQILSGSTPPSWPAAWA